MTSPIELLLERLDEVSDAVKKAYRNELDKETIEELVDVYNQYFFSVQLLQDHLEIKHKFSKFIPYINGKVGSRYCCIKTHMDIIKSKKYEKQLSV